jgi:hypothetical protein
LVRRFFARNIETGEGNRKLDPVKVRKIRAMLLEGATHKDAALRFRVGATTIADIASGKTWSHVCETAEIDPTRRGD